MKQLIDQFKSFTSRNNALCISIYSVFITFFFLHEGSKLVSFALTDLSQVHYSEGTSYGIDISLRVKWMHRFLFISPVLFISIYFILGRFLKNTGKNLIYYEDLLVLSIAGIVLCVMRLFGTDSTHVLSALFFLFIIKLILVVLQHKIRISRSILHPGIFNLSISFGFLLLFSLVFLFGTSDLIHKNYSTVLIISTLLFVAYYYFNSKTLKYNTAKATKLLMPLSTIPLAALLSVEFYFHKKLDSGESINYFNWFIILFAIFSVLIYTYLFLLRKKRTSSAILYKRFIAPALLFTYVLITSYEPVIENVPDMFEPANVFNSSLRVFEFEQIPVLDFMSSHMLSEQWFTYVYSIIFGFTNDLSSLSYLFLNSLIFVFFQYVFLKHLFNRSIYAIAFIFLFPLVNELLYSNVILAVLPLLFIKKLFDKPGSWELTKLLLICCLLIIWRIDTGVVAVFGTLIFFPIIYLIHPKKISLKILLKGKIYFLAIILIIIAIACMMRSPQKIFSNLQLFYHYVGGSQTHGHSFIFQPEAHQFYLYHILFPLLAVAFCLGAIYLLKTKYASSIFNDASLLTCALFMFILYIVHLQRGLVRHGFAENTDDTILSVFPLAGALLLTFFFAKQLPIQRFTFFFGSSFFIFVLLKYFPLQMGKIPIENGITGNRYYNIEKPFDNRSIKGRVICDTAFENDNFVRLKEFMDKTLSKDQTFLDLSNTSMLYYYCNRKIPGYFNQNIENTVDDYQHFELLKELDTQKVPMIILSSYPKNVNDAMDNIPNAMRHYILFEYTYQHYKPLGNINHKNIWVTPQLANIIKDSLPLDPSTYAPQNYDYKLIAEYLGYYYTQKNPADLKSIYKVNSVNLEVEENSYSLKIPDKLSKLPHCFLGITFNKNKYTIDKYPVKIELLNDSSQVIGSFSFERRDKVSNTYMLRLSNHYLWHIQKTSKIRITKDQEITSLEILNDIRTEYKTTNIH